MTSKKTRLLLSLYQNKLFLVIETGFLILFPLFLLQFKPELLYLRKLVMLFSLLYIWFVMKTQEISLRRIGLTTKNLVDSFKPLFIVIILVAISVALFISFNLHSHFLFIEQVANETQYKPLFVILLGTLLSAFLQEIIFRGYYISRLELISKNRFFLTLWPTIIFSLIHIPFNNITLVIFTFILGVIYANNFLKYRNLISLIISHAILIAILLLQMSLIW
ncbi:MAG: hypothetical protein A2570_03725 [Candidatus Brennerbacteria bacterium RIFOXYD1_FULL_41_16]|uniref:CAAX prenyl protease 2/Lysostaphin resistance protein A-like domain-containing protein n=1 Tax=Candidatus Brennerbacteria bacterium RIFOXYD1_FULL_41_16 TaxID=1797529 RepID=A0A1G1XM07_9BACT|nr:MAG: hypothetical protein A2570_03725 [Candidatus Brennerbacteria bacterium RIFOXYD1_FULL_41_16]